MASIQAPAAWSCPSQVLSCMLSPLVVCDSACQGPLSRGFSRQEYWSGLPCPAPGNLPGPGIEPTFPVSPALAGGFFTC